MISMPRKITAIESEWTTYYTTQNLPRITFSFNDLMLKTNRLKKDFFYKDRLIFGLDDPVANMSNGMYTTHEELGKRHTP